MPEDLHMDLAMVRQSLCVISVQQVVVVGQELQYVGEGYQESNP